jgi:Fur family peroxide stress response transcriptional regulator
MTRQRQAVLEAVRKSHDHPTASEIFQLTRRRLPSISYATVYNALRYLKDAGLILEITFGNGASCYDSRTARHDHALCRRCGTLADLEVPDIVKLMPKAALRSQFKAESIYLTLIGLCPECAGSVQETDPYTMRRQV